MNSQSNSLWTIIEARDASIASLEKLLIHQHEGLIEKEAVIQELHRANESAAAERYLAARSLEEKEAVIKSLQETAERFAGQYAVYARQLEEKDSVIQTLQRAVECAKDQHQLLVSGIDEKESNIQALRKSIASAETQVGSLVKRLENSEALVSRQAESVEQLKARLSAMSKGLKEKEAIIEALHQAAANAQSQHQLLAKSLEEKEAAIQSLHKAVNSPEMHFLLLKGLEEKEAVIQELKKSVDAYRAAYSSWVFLARPISRLLGMMQSAVRRGRSIIAPRLGNLNQHAPMQLRLSSCYAFAVSVASPPKISIVTPSFRQAAFIERTLKSVLDQSYPNLEYFVQDGGSEDGTVEILQRYADRLAGWDSRRDNGQSQAINRGFARTSGEIMAWLNSDDILLPGSLACVADYFNRNPKVDVVYGHRILIDENDHQIGRWMLPSHDNEVLSWADYVPQETMFWRRRIWDKAGGHIDETFRFAMDWDLLVRFREAGATFARLPRFLGGFRIHPHQKTSAAISEIGFQEMDRIRQRVHGRIPSGIEIRKAVAPYLLKHVATDLGWRIRNKLGVLS